MKKLLLLLILFSCSKENITPSNVIGCQTGVNRQGVRVLLRCCTKHDFDMGNNVAKGGTLLFDGYTNQKWEQCGSCN